MQLKATDICYTIIRIYNAVNSSFSVHFSHHETFLVNSYWENSVSDYGSTFLQHWINICIWDFYF